MNHVLTWNFNICF